MKNIFYLFICLLFCSQIVKAQVPGYQGKRFLAGYSLYIIPNYPKVFGDDNQYSLRSINLRHSLNAEYIIARKLIFGADLEFTNIDYNYYDLNYSYDNGNYGNYNNNNNNSEALKSTTIGGISYGVHLTSYGVFSHNPVAPVGDYLRFKLFKLNYTTGIPTSEEFLEAIPKPKEKSFSTLGIGLGYGQTRVFFNRALLDVGFETTWLTKNTGFIPNSNSSDNAFPENESLRALFWDYFVTFKIGASGLFF